MNNRVNGAWQVEVRANCPNFTDKEIFEVIICCESKNYKVIFDGKVCLFFFTKLLIFLRWIVHCATLLLHIYPNVHYN